jgi:hypothetical protein
MEDRHQELTALTEELTTLMEVDMAYTELIQKLANRQGVALTWVAAYVG